MKIDDPQSPAASPKPKGTSFKTALQAPAASQRATPRPPPMPQKAGPTARPPVVATARAPQSAHAAVVRAGHAAQASVAAQIKTSHRAHDDGALLVRSTHQTQADASVRVRAGHDETASQRIDQRVLALIVQELSSEFAGTSAQPASAPATASKSTGEGGLLGVQATGRSEAAAAGAPTPTKVEGNGRVEQAVALLERIETFVRSNRPGLSLSLGGALGARVDVERVGPGRVALKVVGEKGPPKPDVIARLRDELRDRGLQLAALSVA